MVRQVRDNEPTSQPRKGKRKAAFTTIVEAPQMKKVKEECISDLEERWHEYWESAKSVVTQNSTCEQKEFLMRIFKLMCGVIKRDG